MPLGKALFIISWCFLGFYIMSFTGLWINISVDFHHWLCLPNTNFCQLSKCIFMPYLRRDLPLCPRCLWECLALGILDSALWALPVLWYLFCSSAPNEISGVVLQVFNLPDSGMLYFCAWASMLQSSMFASGQRYNIMTNILWSHIGMKLAFNLLNLGLELERFVDLHFQVNKQIIITAVVTEMCYFLFFYLFIYFYFLIKG